MTIQIWHKDLDQRAWEGHHLHFAHTFVDIGLWRQRRDLIRGELEHANFALLGCYLGSDYVDLLLGRDSLALDFLNKLEMPLSVAWIIDFALSCKGLCRIAVD